MDHDVITVDNGMHYPLGWSRLRGAAGLNSAAATLEAARTDAIVWRDPAANRDFFRADTSARVATWGNTTDVWTHRWNDSIDVVGSVSISAGLTVSGGTIDLDPTGAFALDMDATFTAVITVADNLANAFLVREGTRTYFDVSTLDSGAVITWGNATTNPKYVWTGSGDWSVGGGVGTAGQILTSNGANLAPTWQGSPMMMTGWTDDGTVVRLTTASDTVAIGVATMSGTEKVRIVGALRVEGDNELNVRTNGQLIAIKSATELHTLAAAVQSDTVIQVPAGALVFFVSARVTTAIMGPVNWQYGLSDDGTPNRYGNNLAVAAGTTSKGFDASTLAATYSSGAVSIRLRAQDGVTAFTAGIVRITIHYLEVTAPTS